MDRFAAKQRQIELRRVEAATCYPVLWSRLIAGWRAPGPEDAAWLMYSANYLFRSGDVRWAIDPLALTARLPDAPGVDVAADWNRYPLSC